MSHPHTYDFRAAVDAALANAHRREVIGKVSVKADQNRQAVLPRDFPGQVDNLRDLAARIKARTLARLDEYLTQFIDRFEARGGKVHFAGSHEEARQIVVTLCREAAERRPEPGVRSQESEENAEKSKSRKVEISAGLSEQKGAGDNQSPDHPITRSPDPQSAKTPAPLRIVKVKSMVGEELHLLSALEAEGFDAWETDLGEFIAQVGHRRPAHIVGPVMDMNRHDISALFHDQLNQPRTDDPRTLTMQARQLLRERFRQADVGLSGGNFLVAETGTLVLCTNEGNGRMCTTVPDTHIAVVGIEKAVPTWKEAAVLLKLLTRSASAHDLTVYTSLINGPRQPGEPDGPRHVHLVLLDAGRSNILAREKYHEALQCIRCGACLYACPVFRQIGGQPYGGTYSGPIGKVITPLLLGEHTYCDLPNASSLCGACLAACPVKIDIPRMLIELRADQNARKETPFPQRMMVQLWAGALLNQQRYETAQSLFGWFWNPHGQDGWIHHLPAAQGWTGSRDFPAPADKPFRQIWRETGGEC